MPSRGNKNPGEYYKKLTRQDITSQKRGFGMLGARTTLIKTQTAIQFFKDKERRVAEMLWEIASNYEHKAAIRLQALINILDRVMGKPKQMIVTVDHSDEDVKEMSAKDLEKYLEKLQEQREAFAEQLEKIG